MRTIAFIDTYYDQVLKDNPPNPLISRSEQLAKLCFGTSDFYSDAFKKMGWGAYDIVGNDSFEWNNQLVFEHLRHSAADVIYCQDLCYFSADQIREFKNIGKAVVGQISSKWPGDEIITSYDLLFTSFPHYLKRFQAVSVRGEFLPIAFGEQVLEYVNPVNRDIDISFVGGLGASNNGGYWDKGTALFEQLAGAFPSFQWWGYFIGRMSDFPNLSRAYRGPSWGLDQYKIYARSKIVVNRHGEVAEGHSNNMRMFEATGMGACLFTEMSHNLNSYFAITNECWAYSNAENLISGLKKILECDCWKKIGEAGQARTLKDHTYAKRLMEIEPIIRKLIK